MLDGYGKNIDYAEIYLTDKCNLRCVYCRAEDNIPYNDNSINDALSLYEYKFIINGLSQVGIKKINFTGGEPLLYQNLVELIRYTHYECNIDDISITTHGIGLHEVVDEFKKNGLKTVNISLDSLKSYKYKEITRGGNLNDVLKSINRCLELGVKVNINCVIIDTFNDDEIYDYIDMANYYPVDIRFIELMPFGEGQYIYEEGYFNLSEYINQIDILYKTEDEKDTNAKMYKVNHSKGRIGIITDVRYNTCNKVIVTLDGKIKLSMHSNEEVDIRYYLNKPMIFKEILRESIYRIMENNDLLLNLI